MWTSTLDLNPEHMLLMRLLSYFWRGACFSSLSPLHVQNLPRPSLPANNWVRVRNRLAGVSGSDLRLMRGENDPRVAPAALSAQRRIYPGREVVGEVIEVGEDVQLVRVGDRVVLQKQPNCVAAGIQNLCRSCEVGEYNLCERVHLPGPQPVGGGWSEEMLVHEQLLFTVAAELNDEQAVMLEPTAIALHALLRRPPEPGEHVLIIGAGTIGLLILQLVRVLMPRVQVSMLARHAFQVEQATRMGAAHIIYPHDSYTGVQRATGAQRYQGLLDNRMLMGGYDVVYDTVGSNRTLHHALRWVRARGAVVLIGMSPTLMHIDLSPAWFQQIDLLGSHSHSMDKWPPGKADRQMTFSIVQQLMKNGEIRPEQLITHRFALNNYREALLTAMSKQNSRAIKVVFDYSLLPASVVPNVRASARKPRPAVVNSSQTTRRPAMPDPVQDWPDVPVTPLPVPLYDEVESDDTVHALPAIAKSDLPSSQPAPISNEQPLEQAGQEEHRPDDTRADSTLQEEPYIAADDEATVVVRMSDVEAAYRAMEALSEPGAPSPAASTEATTNTLPSTDGWLAQQDDAPSPPQEEASEAEDTGEQIASNEAERALELADSKEQPAGEEEASTETEIVNEPAVVEEQQVYTGEAQEEEMPVGSAEDAGAVEPIEVEERQTEMDELRDENGPPSTDTTLEALDAPDGEQSLQQEQLPEQPDTELPEFAEEVQMATNVASQVSQQPGKVFTVKTQSRTYNNGNKKKRR